MKGDNQDKIEKYHKKFMKDLGFEFMGFSDYNFLWVNWTAKILLEISIDEELDSIIIDFRTKKDKSLHEIIQNELHNKMKKNRG